MWFQCLASSTEARAGGFSRRLPSGMREVFRQRPSRLNLPGKHKEYLGLDKTYLFMVR